MYDIKNFDNWLENSERGQFGSGASEKKWLINPDTKEEGLFKFPKIKTDNSITGEYWAEKLASEIAKLLEIKCADVDVGTFKGRIGSMSYNILNKNDILTEGITFIQQKYPFYDKDKLKDMSSLAEYSIQMIEKSIPNINDILMIVLFDALIGNSDRHHSNWAYLYHNQKEKTLCPLYDNGSSLCSYIDTKDAKIIIKDSMRYNALINSKSKSMIGWYNKRPIKHFELIQNISHNYYNNTFEFVQKIQKNINETSIKNILDKFSDNIISNEMKKLLLKFILDRKNIILSIYNLKD